MLAFLHCTLPTPLLFQDTAIWKFWNTSACTSKESWFTGWLCHHLPRILHQCSLSWIDPHSHWQLTSLCAVLCHFSPVQLFVTLWVVARQAPLSIGFSRQKYWSGLLCPLSGDLLNLRIEPAFFMSPAWLGLFTTSTTWEALFLAYCDAV